MRRKDRPHDQDRDPDRDVDDQGPVDAAGPARARTARGAAPPAVRPVAPERAGAAGDPPADEPLRPGPRRRLSRWRPELVLDRLWPTIGGREPRPGDPG